MAIADNLNRIIQAKADIKAAIENKGITVGDITIDGYAAKIAEIEGGGTSKIRLAGTGIKLGDSTFTEVPDYIDFDGVTTMSYMFNGCSKLTSVPLFDTSNVTTMSYMFQNCSNLTSVPLFDTSNVTNMQSMFQSCSNLTSLPQFDTSKVKDMNNMFGNCSNLTSVPLFDTSNVTTMNNMFRGCSNLTSLPAFNVPKVTNMSYMFYNNIPNLTDVGGWIDLKCNWNGSYGLAKCPNLTYESCINVLNGLFDFVGAGITPDSSQGKLKVHSNFLTTVGDEISIATNKGWQVIS